MKPSTKYLDTFQLITFTISGVVSLGLLIVTRDIQSVILGFVLATLFQAFDLQIRHNQSEERLLKASALNQALYYDEWLLKEIQQIVNDYQAVKEVWFDLFKLRGAEAVTDCRKVLHSMAEGNLVVQSGGPYSSGAYTIPKARKTAKAVAAIDDHYWRSPEAETYVRENADAVRRGVQFIRVFTYQTTTLSKMIDILESQHSLGIEVYVAPSETLPKELNEDYLVVDDRLLFRTEQEGKLQKISVDKSEIEQMTRRFDSLLRHAKKLENVIDSLKKSD